MGNVDNRRIAKNTLLLYMRMGLIMLISLWASRVVLSTLGQTDFGLYNVIGGIVVAFSFLGSVMNSACNRYYSTELGRGDMEALHQVFKVNLTIFLILAAAILLLSETLGLWLFERKMNIPADRLTACRWVYQLSIGSFLAGVVDIPYRAIITAKEKMKVYAYCSVVEAVLKFASVFLLAVSPIDKLVFYALLMLLVSLATSGFYIFYCIRFYPECRYDWHCDKSLAREILSFNGWGVLGSMATIGKNQGVNILLNMFFGPAVNAARGLANQVYVNVYQFVQNYVLAFNPQIVKSYAAGERSAMMRLVFQASRFSYFLLYAIVLPLLLEMDCVLGLWLTEVPEHTASFASIMLAVSLVDSFHDPLFYAVQATGRVKWYNILVGGSQLLIVFVAYFLLKCFHILPEMVFWLIFIFAIITQGIRIGMAVRFASMDLRSYLRGVLLPIVAVSAVSAVLPFVFVQMVPAGVGRLLLTIAISLACTGLAVWSIGLEKSERSAIRNLWRKYITRKAPR